MAAIDKMNEFYTNSARFGFLASAYRPDAFPEEINQAMDILVNYFNNDVDFKAKVEEANDYFEEAHEQLQMIKRKDLLGELVKECAR